MSRTADEVMTHHIDTMMKMDLDNALSDYSEELIAITRLDGRNRTLGYDSLSTIMENSYKIADKLGLDVENAVQKLHILCRQSVEHYVVLLAELKPFSSFASFTYMVEDGRAVYVTGYAKTFSMPSIGVKAHPFERSTETMRVVETHLEHLRAKDVPALIGDYAKDAVVITNLADRPFEGEEAVARYCRELTQKASAQIEALTDAHVKLTLKEAVGELGCVGFDHRRKKQHGVLTQRIRNGKIIFESAMFENASPILLL